MPRRISEYTVADWKRLRPLTHALKTQRYQWVDRRYLKRAAQAGDTRAASRAVAGRDVLVTIAFNDPELIRWQVLLVRYHVPRALHFIADNSSHDEAAAKIAQIAASNKLPYLRLPKNPWRAFSRSHGIALNWIWHNVLQPGAPAAFGFIDHDLFPTAADDPFAPLRNQDFFGLVRPVGPRWFLWAGFCMFRFAAVKDKPLDFGQDWFIGLDTGGANWEVLYRHVDRSALQEANSFHQPYKPGIDVRDGPIQWCGTWLHEVGTTGNDAINADKRRVVAEMLAPHLRAAGERQPVELGEVQAP